jgi:putative ABC transport system permease protein
LEEWGNYQPWNWFFYTYVSIPTSVNATDIEERIASVNAKLETLRTETRGARILLQPITDIHLKSQLVDELEANGNSTLVYFLGGIGLVILIIAWINYINLETGRFIVRAKDIAIRRLVGSTKRSLALQFLLRVQ